MYCIDDPLVGAVKGIMTLSLAENVFLQWGRESSHSSDLSHVFCRYILRNADRMKRNVFSNTCHRSLSKPRIDTLPSLRDAFSRQLITYTTVYLKNFRNIFRHFVVHPCLNKIILLECVYDHRFSCFDRSSFGGLDHAVSHLPLESAGMPLCLNFITPTLKFVIISVD